MLHKNPIYKILQDLYHTPCGTNLFRSYFKRYMYMLYHVYCFNYKLDMESVFKMMP